jgi:hypothetical protein
MVVMVNTKPFAILIGLYVPLVPIICHAGILNKLFGIGDFETCIEDGSHKAKTSREIQEVYETCKVEYPKALTFQGSQKPSVSVPLVPLPKVPSATKPLIPVVPAPLQ